MEKRHRQVRSSRIQQKESADELERYRRQPKVALLAWRREGLTLEEIGAKLGVTKQRVAQIERKYGLARSRRGQDSMHREREAKVLSWRAKGLTLREVAGRLGVSLRRVAKIERVRRESKPHHRKRAVNAS